MTYIDLHCDTLSRLRDAKRRGEPKALRANDLHVDLDKLRRGGCLLQCFAAYVDLGREADPLAAALEQMDILDEELAENADAIAPVRTWSELEANRRAGKLSAMLTLEEGAICRSPDALPALYDRGARIMTLTWNHENAYAYPNEVAANRPDTVRGLKPAGIELMREMERLGMIVDVSHLSDAGIYDVIRHARKPFIASHSNARAVCGHVRNLPDDMLRAIADRGGVTGLNFCVDFLDPAGGTGTVGDMAAHIGHIRRVGGIDMIALGTDFDGIDRAPELYDCSQLPRLADALRRRGFSDDAIEKIFRGNVLRLLKDALPD